LDKIYDILSDDVEHTPDEAMAAEAAMEIAGELVKSQVRKSRPREKDKLWASDLGKPCMRQQWYKFNKPEAGEKLDGHTKFKFLYGNILESAALYLAREAGYKIDHQQGSVEWTSPNGTKVTGRIDSFIDDVLVDVKSTSSYGFSKYKKSGIHTGNDTFGYLWQLGFYKAKQTLEPNSNAAGFLWIDKQNGHLLLQQCHVPNEEAIEDRVHLIEDAINKTNVEDNARYYMDRADGKSGNRVLGTECSYCPYKVDCWPGLRAFDYSGKPRFLTEVVRTPKVTEIPLEKNDE
jgi:hypothetical protein